MGLSIKNRETENLVRELARRRGIGVTRAIKLAVSNELARNTSEPKNTVRIHALVREIQQRWSQTPPIDMKEVDDWMYDENGLPH
jgi:antitoxin VapB